MFWPRFITAIVLIPLVLLAILHASPWILVELVLFIVLVCGWEWLQLIPLKRNLHKFIFMGALICALGMADIIGSWLLIPGLLLWILIVFAEITFPVSQRYWGHIPVVAGSALVLLPLFLQSLMQIYGHPHGKILLIYMLFLVWAADTGAYLAGKLWGKHKLIPAVSPGKSLEGLIGGFILAAPVIFAGWLYLKLALMPWLILGFCMVIISVIGDLFISMLKRRVHLKDTGSVIPGHGGFLDRLDSLIAVSPLFYAGLIFYLPGT